MKRNFSDLSVIISVRIDSEERLENMLQLVDFLHIYTTVRMYVVEADVEQKLPELNVEEQLFFQDSDPVFHRTRYSNIALKHTTTPYVGIWDADVLIDLVQLEKAMEFLRLKDKTVVIPYDGRCYDLSPKLCKDFLQNPRFTCLDAHLQNLSLKFGVYALGGIFLTYREHYMLAGWENEYFYGWGHEDLERVKRMEILGANLGFVKGPIFHSIHPRLKNSVPAPKGQDEKNRNELLKICRMNASALREYIKSWDWLY